ncbi:MAG: hypothetical protein WAO71_06320 [Gallionella sp.]
MLATCKVDSPLGNPPLPRHLSAFFDGISHRQRWIAKGIHLYHRGTFSEGFDVKLSTKLCDGRVLFFTVNLLERWRTLLTDHIDLLRDSVQWVRRLYPFHIDACVILPDHLHCVWTLPPDADDFATRFLQIKPMFSKDCQ